ncbi:MAG TPA: xanthine dehydrogenase family protein [Candidatus Eisenbacteria bacterium]|nr:xanthine dehydrogenase family protein [Candidatus Eisenbacteria bacterium]
MGQGPAQPIPYGKIKSINVQRALELPRVCAVLTGADVAGLQIGRRIYDMPILAEDRVRFVGEKVAAVAAEDESTTEPAVSLIDVDYEPWEPLLDPLKALEPGAPLLHPDVLSYRGLPHPLTSPSNAFIQMRWAKGDIQEGFREADGRTNTFTTSKMHQAYLEPHSCLVSTDASGSAEIWAFSKVPYPLREQLANALNVCEEKLLIHPSFIGGDFGGKGDFMDVALAYCLSRQSRRPVKIVMDYEEEFIAANPRHASIVNLKTGVKRDGRIIAQQIEITYGSGAYAAFKPLGYLTGAHACAGPYRIPNVLIEEKIVYTNTVPCGHMRGPGDPQGFFANESQLDIVARELGIDRIELRRKNLMVDGDEAPTGETIHYIKTHDTLEDALSKAGYFAPKKQHVGRGVALTHWVSNGGKGGVSLSIDERGHVTLSSAMLDQGSGGYTVLCEIVSQELNVPIEQIKVNVLDTGAGLKDTGVGASRATRVYDNACYYAVSKAKEEFLRQAAGYLGCYTDDLLLVGGAVLHKRAERKISYGELLRALGAPITVQGTYDDMSEIHESPVCAQVAEVAVDPETGAVTCRSSLPHITRVPC